ncbi:MAG TPA: TIGR03013 family XrtA/PEP-CTERM system glycosyltransferase [Gammaproteobacteria bacterium]|nr:TIGR03013 family XrtA/PEP-CTERM system glycosyltransferase [Gammaproteobacteria bacterium]
MSVNPSLHSRLFRYLPIFEAALLGGAVYLAVFVRFGADRNAIAFGVGPVWPQAAMFAGVLLLSLTAMGLYNRRLRDSLEGVIVRVLLAFLFGMMVLTLLYYLSAHALLGRGILALALLTGFTGIVATRAVLLRILVQEGGKRRVLVLGAGRRAFPLTRLRRRTDLIGLRIVGFLPVAGDGLEVPEERRVRIDGSLAEWVRTHRVQEIVVAADERRGNIDMEQLLQCRAAGAAISELQSFYERETGRVNIEHLLPSWLAFSSRYARSAVGDLVKESLDILTSLVLLVLASPIMLLAALAVWLESGCRGPVFYRQTRVGENGREFQLLKFRSMRTDAEQAGGAQWARKHDPRVTRVGAILRRYRIDELPQIYNILRGEMSFVGPRPERPEFVGRLQSSCPHYGERHRVRPGLTGWAQIYYPYGASDEDAFQKLQYDLYYVTHHSLYLDLMILLQTVEVVLWGRGVR